METTETQIGLIGDVHGNLEALRLSIRALAQLGIHHAIQLGDFAMWFDQRSLEAARRDTAVRNLEDILVSHDFRLSVIGGNHESWGLIEAAQAQRADGFAVVSPHCVILPRVHVQKISAGGSIVRIGSLAGANSIDRSMRRPAKPGVFGSGSWWEQEQITEAHVDELIEKAGPHGLDVLLGHEQPSHPALVQRFDIRPSSWSTEALIYAHESRTRFTRAAIETVRNGGLTVGGHYHVPMDSMWATQDGREIRSVGLDMEGASWSCAVLDLPSLDLHEVSVLTPTAWEMLAKRGIRVGAGVTAEQLEDVLPQVRASIALGEKVIAVMLDEKGAPRIEVED